MYADRKIGASHETYVFVIDVIVDHVITFFSSQLLLFPFVLTYRLIRRCSIAISFGSLVLRTKEAR